METVLSTKIMKNDMNTDQKPGWKTREMEKNYAEFTVNFIDALHAKGFLKLHFDSDEQYIEKVLIRLSSTNQSFGKLYEIVSDLNKFSHFKDAMKPFEFTGDDIMRMFTGLFVHCKLEEFEFLKTIMLMITEKKQYGTGKKGNPKMIRGTETLGQLLPKYDDILDNYKITDHINNELRNALAHGKWWTRSFHFCFIGKDGQEKQYDIPQLFIEAIHIATFVRIFYEKGFERATQIKRG